MAPFLMDFIDKQVVFNPYNIAILLPVIHTRANPLKLFLQRPLQDPPSVSDFDFGLTIIPNFIFIELC